MRFRDAIKLKPGDAVYVKNKHAINYSRYRIVKDIEIVEVDKELEALCDAAAMKDGITLPPGPKTIPQVWIELEGLQSKPYSRWIIIHHGVVKL